MTRRIAENFAAVRASVAEACREADRPPASVRIVGVTKSASVDEAMSLFEAGCHDLAESRPQELWKKAAAFEAAGLAARWHLIGHLQRNKVRRTLPLVHLFHSVDSLRLLRAIDEEARAAGRVADVLVEANLAGAAGRTGVAVEEVPAIVAASAGCVGVRLRGLMGMASAPGEGADPAEAVSVARRQFATLRQLRDELRRQAGYAPLEELSMGPLEELSMGPLEELSMGPLEELSMGPLEELSMGMSGDFREAILEGATIVRIGSSLFEDRG